LRLVTEEPARRFETVELYRTGAAAKIVLNRPERMNAWSNALSRDLLAVLRDLAVDDEVRAVMLTGAGRAFCSGADLKEGATSGGGLDTDGVLIDASWPDEEFEQNAEALLLRLSNGPTRSYAGTKRELNHWVYSRMAEHLALEASIQGELAKSKDFAEGITAFMEKRPTHFTGE
jgi:enoyl-CoA hydratase/carnithine racemase